MAQPPDSTERLTSLAAFGASLAEQCGLEDVIDTALAGLHGTFGFGNVLVMIHQPDTDRLTTIASHGYDIVGIGSEVRLGQGVIGTAASTRRPMRIGNLQRMLAYLRTVQEAADGGTPGTEIRLPGLVDARSQVAAPMVVDGRLIGVIAAESDRALAFDDTDQLVLTIAAQLMAGALERAEVSEPDTADEVVPLPDGEVITPAVPQALAPSRPPSRLRYYSSDGSTFIDDEYVIKGVAGRLLWKLATEHAETGRTAYTNREARLDPTLDMPSFRDNFESRLVLLKRRLEERDAPLRIHRTARGRFEVESLAAITFDQVMES